MHRMSRLTLIRAGLWAVAVTDALVGAWAAFAPRSFFDTFPGLGRTWVSALPPYNEHLARDVGGLNLVLAALFVAAAVRPDRFFVRAICLASLLWAIPHLAFHYTHFAGLETVDVVAQGFTLLVAVALPIAIAIAVPQRTE